MKNIFYIEKYIKTFQICQNLSKITKISTKLSKEINEIQNHFSKRLEKMICSKAKFIKKLNALIITFFFQVRDVFYFTLDYYLLFVFNEIQLIKQSLLFDIRFIQIRFQFFTLRFKSFSTRKI